MAAARKRSRTEAEEAVEEKERAECPFTVRTIDPKEKEKKKKLKRRKTDGDEDDGPKIMQQLSPFAPSGKFKTHETMDQYYTVEPIKQWTEMTRYNSFVLNGTKYFSEGFIYVANESTMQKSAADKTAPKRTMDDWVARILEIRASDEHHVYARIYWMYWPDELLPGTHDGKKTVHGRQPYHGKFELVASNHMDIINVVSVTGPAQVKQWYEDNDEETQNGLYWRQAFDGRTYELSTVDPVCKCRAPENPDKTLIGCTSDTCKVWLHEDCIKHEALMKTFERLGKDKPHRSSPSTTLKDEDGEGKRPLSPKEPPVADSAHHSIDVRQDADGEPDAVHVKDVDAKQANDEDAQAAPEDQVDTSRAGSQTQTADKDVSGKKLGRPRSRKGPEANGTTASANPYEGLFEATLRTDLQPSMLEFKDLRPNVNGEKTWLEPIDCLVCGSRIE